VTEPAPPPPPGYPGQPAPGYTPPSGPSGPRASFGRRLVAYLVDGLILSVPYLVLWPALGQTAAYVITLIIDLAYFGYFEGSPSGQTIGKRLLSIRVIDFQTGGPIGYPRALGRYLGKILSGIACLLGYLWMLWDREKQTWHDKLVTSVVVPTAAYPVERWPG
jgi:uncharacterized RDD family membrane protein YckC